MKNATYGTFAGFCVKCRAKRLGINHKLVRWKNGRIGVVAKCEYCSTTIARVYSKDYLGVDFTPPPTTANVVAFGHALTRQLASYFANHPSDLYSIPPAFFEEMVAEILHSFGFEVHLNVRLLGKSSGDEADILAFAPLTGLKRKVGYIVECKRFPQDRKVNLQIATHLYGLKQRHAEQWGLHSAILATTSTVTREVVKEYGARWDFEIRDHRNIVEWLKEYSERPLYRTGLVDNASNLDDSIVLIAAPHDHWDK